MKGLNRNIIRALLIGSYCMLIALVVYGISALFSYLNTGADRSSMLHTEIKKENLYQPKINWAPINNEGRKIDAQTLKTLEADYLNACYVKHIAYKTNTKTGLKDYYTDSARKNIEEIIDLNTDENIHIEATTLSHNPVLDFFSEDGQLAVITDKDVIEFKRVFKDEKLILETTEKSTYKLVFLLEDGFWRIRHMVAVTSESHKLKQEVSRNLGLHIKGINYYPKNTPWNMFGEAFDNNVISNDFKIIKNAGLNSIRIFIPYEDFGKESVLPEKLSKLKQVLDTAHKHNLKAIITLFDFYGDYSILDWTLNRKHAETVVSTFKNHEAIAAWDIKNEPNLDFEPRGKKNVLNWLQQMLQHVKSIDQTHPVTIGWSNVESATLLKDEVDFVSFHYYQDLDNLEASIKQLKKEIPNTTIVMQEFGMSSDFGLWNPLGNSEKSQATYYKKAQEIIAEYDLQYMSWTLYDFKNIPTKVTGSLPWRKNAQKHYGFINTDGNKKMAFDYISKR